MIFLYIFWYVLFSCFFHFQWVSTCFKSLVPSFFCMVPRLQVGSEAFHGDRAQATDLPEASQGSGGDLGWLSLQRNHLWVICFCFASKTPEVKFVTSFFLSLFSLTFQCSNFKWAQYGCLKKVQHISCFVRPRHQQRLGRIGKVRLRWRQVRCFPRAAVAGGRSPEQLEGLDVQQLLKPSGSNLRVEIILIQSNLDSRLQFFQTKKKNC